MEVLRTIPELTQLSGPLFLAIGVFDGVHLGHQAVISTSATNAARHAGTPVVVTFDPHPAKLLRPDAAPRLLTATQHKISLIRNLGVAHLLVLQFDREFANTTPEDFVQQLAHHSRPLREICVGHEWSFGKGRSGNLGVLKQLGNEHGFDVIGIPPVTVGGQTVSSTAIRRAVESGDFAAAREMLGREYTVLGTVTAGSHLGRELGFPTANLSAHNEQFPPNGVYLVEATFDRTTYGGVANLGYRPTVEQQDPQRTLEVHFFDLHRDIYGEDVELRFVRYLRAERKFDSLHALAKQIAADVEQARQLAEPG